LGDPSDGGTLDPANFKAILDHDTNVFCTSTCPNEIIQGWRTHNYAYIDALSAGQLFLLNMDSLTSANSTSLSWTLVGTPSFDTTGYDPVMAVAQNHVHFIGVPGLNPGEADIFVIHCG
jgi:hypothetical protein